MIDTIEELWEDIYGTAHEQKRRELLELLEERKQALEYTPDDPDWYKKGVVYSLYVDLFADDFDGLIEKLAYLDELGVTTIWLLPILESPMVDQGFDVSDYTTVRDELGGTDQFLEFVEAAHERDIKIVFDIPINHSSDQHEWFQNAREDEDAEYRDYYIWNDDTTKYEETRLLLKGISDSNWAYNEPTDDYYFHRFYDIQPDLNYRNPDVLIEMIDIFSYWKINGVDGFRMDAAPFLWKEEGTDCENLPETHTILKLYRAALDYLGEGTAIIAEANQEPEDVVDYFGDGDECHIGYNFPVMPKFYLALAESDPTYLTDELATTAALDVPESAQWFTFLRVHDELTLEFVTDEEREKMNDYYLEDERWTFREGEGISGRLYNLVDEDPGQVLLLYSLLFAVDGTPIIYYGDEVGMENDLEFYREMNEKFGYRDSRFLHRGPFDEERKRQAIEDPESDSHAIWTGLREMIDLKREHDDLFSVAPEYRAEDGVFISTRRGDATQLTIYANVSPDPVTVDGHELAGHGYEWVFEDR